MDVVASVLQVVLALAFVVAGGSKLARTRQQLADFGRFHYPAGTMQLVGAIELLAAAGLLAGLVIEALAVVGGVLVIGLMLFRLYSHLSRVGGRDRTVVPVVFAVLALAVVLIRFQAVLQSLTA